jgi:hypothetical protein
MVEKKELNLDNPIFVIYLKTDGLSVQRAEELLYRTYAQFDIYSNITIWIFPSDRTLVECVYDGGIKNRTLELKNLINKINHRVDLLSKSSNTEDFKMNIRDWRLEDILEDESKDKR